MGGSEDAMLGLRERLPSPQGQGRQTHRRCGPDLGRIFIAAASENMAILQSALGCPCRICSAYLTPKLSLASSLMQHGECRDSAWSRKRSSWVAPFVGLPASQRRRSLGGGGRTADLRPPYLSLLPTATYSAHSNNYSSEMFLPQQNERGGG